MPDSKKPKLAPVRGGHWSRDDHRLFMAAYADMQTGFNRRDLVVARKAKARIDALINDALGLP
jgi:hypothetical protein